MSKGKLFSLSVTFINKFLRYKSKQEFTFSQDTEVSVCTVLLERFHVESPKEKEPLLEIPKPKEALFEINSIYPSMFPFNAVFWKRTDYL